MGMTRATSVRCPWCARPVGDGVDRPEVCPSCGVPLARPVSVSAHPVTFAVPAARARRGERLRAVAAILTLTSVLLAITATAVAVAVLRHDGADSRATTNLVTVLRAAEEVRRQTGQFAGALPVVLEGKVFAIDVVDSTAPSTNGAQISMMVAGDGWYGAVRSTSGRCFAAATINGDPHLIEVVLPHNCTGDAARAALAPLGPAATISAVPGDPSIAGT